MASSERNGAVLYGVLALHIGVEKFEAEQSILLTLDAVVPHCQSMVTKLTV